MRLSLIIGMALVMLSGQSGFADTAPPKIADVRVKLDSQDQPGIFHFKVTIEHRDQGWEDYVDVWEIRSTEGQLLGSRPFFEPELEEATTVTALSGVVIPAEHQTVLIHARKHPAGYISEPVEVTIPH